MDGQMLQNFISLYTVDQYRVCVLPGSLECFSRPFCHTCCGQCPIALQMAVFKLISLYSWHNNAIKAVKCLITCLVIKRGFQLAQRNPWSFSLNQARRCPYLNLHLDGQFASQTPHLLKPGLSLSHNHVACYLGEKLH